MSTEVNGPLAGIKVLDLTSVVMGPVATRSLGDMGADVIAVEPAIGDRNRAMGAGPHEEFSGVSLNLMRNKRSISIDLKTQRGRQALLDIAATCDVMVTNLRPGPLGRLGLDYETVRGVRDDIVFCRAHGYPSDSVDAEAPAYDDIIQSASGFADLFSLMGAEPSLMPTLIADKVCGMAIANAILAALLHRAKTGQGQDIEIPMIDVMKAFVLTEHGSGAMSEPPVAEAGYPRILTTARKPQPTADSWINILPYDDTHYNALFTEGGRPDLVDNERFRTRQDRTVNSDSLYRDVAALLPSQTTEHWLRFCAENKIPATEATTLDELVKELPLAEHPEAGTYRVIPPPERFSITPSTIRRAAPTIGQHGRELLTEVGYSDAALDELESLGVLNPAKPD
ncbi:MAG: CaiB/BaiF CoA transferase family protein [Acidimicrobiales bacterium]